MRRALRLAQKGYGATSPNPMVGAIIVRQGEIIGEGWHQRTGEPHAEINAINSARRRGKDELVSELRRRGCTVATGVFGARMQVSSVNEGPMTLLLEV